MPRDEKDILIKALTGALSEDALLEVLGIAEAHVVEPLPTELDTWKQQVDMLWRMKDGALFHMEFQTTRELTLHRFLLYDARLAYQYHARIRTVVLYHGNVMDATDVLNIGTAHYHVENVYLGALDGDAALDTVAGHLGVNIWTPADRWRLSLALTMKLTRRSRPEALDAMLDLLHQVPDEQERNFVVAGILGLTERILTDAEHIRLRKELMQMSRLAKEILEEGREEGREEGKKEGSYAKAVEVAKKLLADGMPSQKVALITALTPDEVEIIRRQVL